METLPFTPPFRSPASLYNFAEVEKRVEPYVAKLAEQQVLNEGRLPSESWPMHYTFAVGKIDPEDMQLLHWYVQMRGWGGVKVREIYATDDEDEPISDDVLGTTITLVSWEEGMKGANGYPGPAGLTGPMGLPGPVGKIPWYWKGIILVQTAITVFLLYHYVSY